MYFSSVKVNSVNFSSIPSSFVHDSIQHSTSKNSYSDNNLIVNKPKDDSFDSPFESTETVSHWWKRNYAAYQGDDVNQSVDEALFPQSDKPSNKTKLFTAKSDDDIFSGIQDSSDIHVRDDVKIIPQDTGSTGHSFIPPFSTERKTNDKVDYPKYQGDLMTATSDITFDIQSRIDQHSLKNKKTPVAEYAHGKPSHVQKPRQSGHKPVVSDSSDNNHVPTDLISLLAGKITCGALGPLMAAFDDPSSRNNTYVTSTAVNRDKRNYDRNGGSTDATSYDEHSHVGSEISSRIYLSRKVLHSIL
jgi:hypothetical protein